MFVRADVLRQLVGGETENGKLGVAAKTKLHTGSLFGAAFCCHFGLGEILPEKVSSGDPMPTWTRLSPPTCFSSYCVWEQCSVNPIQLIILLPFMSKLRARQSSANPTWVILHIHMSQFILTMDVIKYHTNSSNESKVLPMLLPYGKWKGTWKKLP